MLLERTVGVQVDPPVDLFIAEAPAARSDAPCLLVVHGGPDWDHSYLVEPLVHLADQMRVLFVDLRGCGRSTRGLPDAEYTPERATTDLVTLLDRVGLRQAAVLGFSYGGLIAQRLAVAAPDRVSRLVIASSSVLPAPQGAFAGWDERDQRLASQTALEEIDPPTPEAIQAAAMATASTNVWQLELLPEYTRRLEQIRFSADWAGPWQRGTLPSPRLSDPIASLAATRIPMLLLHGRQDMTFPVELAEQAQDLLPGAQAVILDDAGHMAHIDQPDAWLAAVRAFLTPARS